MGLSLPPLLLPHPPTPSLTPHSFLAAGKTGELPKSADGSYGTSITLSKALDRASDVILAYKQNGRLLTPDHGYPLRIIIPGYVGGRMVKWLEEVCVSAEESQNHYHFFDNRVLPSHVDEALANAEGELARRAALHGVWWAAWRAAWRARLPAAGLVPAAYQASGTPCPAGGPACLHRLPPRVRRLVQEARLHHQRHQHPERHRLPSPQRGGAPRSRHLQGQGLRLRRWVGG